MDNTTKDVFEAIANLASLTDKMEETQWIILESPINVASGATRILRVGSMIRVACAHTWPFLADCADDLGPTHVIISLRNNIHNTAFEIDCEVIGGDEMITIKL